MKLNEENKKNWMIERERIDLRIGEGVFDRDIKT